MAAKAKKEGKFGLSHIFSTVAITVATTMVVGPMFEFNWTHYSEIGQALSQIGNHYFMPVFDAMGAVVMPFLEPIVSSLDVAQEIAGQTTDGASIIADGSGALSAGEGTIPQLGGEVPSLGGSNIPTLE